MATTTIDQQLLFAGTESGKMFAMREIIQKVWTTDLYVIYNFPICFVAMYTLKIVAFLSII